MDPGPPDTRPGDGDDAMAGDDGYNEAGEEYEEEEEEGEEEAMATSDDEDYNLTHFGIAQALPVPDGPPDPDAGPPQTAEEYLRLVRYEASRCPRITRVELDPEMLQRREAARQKQLEAEAQAEALADEAGPSSSGGRDRGGGGGGGGGGRGPRRRVVAIAAQTPPPVTSDCAEWARPSDKWLRVFLQVGPGSRVGGWWVGVGREA
ncbi:hypothetical protein GPECTOR_20g536 [Gonium pectorale]|uniref:Uncharacterized protein n=1 Tax=Gonium pectorale TaxID=33097 RepID=A0A150GIN9_GONPE|nr:hypothetical protein GPECTOR_20g536 [Gonium pectorale]|eukprot:KXZ49679.1 hypothetical protein GPECTOR_20g536 [Gonium pectorale]